MARISCSQDFERSTISSLDRKLPQIDDDNLSVLDDNILDCNAPNMSTDTGHRRESFATSATAYSSTDAGWSGYHYGVEPVPVQQHSSAQGFINQHGSTFSSTAPSSSVQYSQTPTWHISGTSGSCTPTPNYEGSMTEYEGSRTAAHHLEANHSSHSAIYENSPGHATPRFKPNNLFGTTVQATKDWISATSSEPREFSSIPPHSYTNSPPFTSSAHLLRPDGIRKKNARFEIPAERNLRTIDHLINQTSDEQEIKELKQQKRLLRNRQAALDSRQRKKQHTERLEEEKKHYTSIISELEDALGEMKIRESEWVREKDKWASAQQQYEQYIDTLVMEKEELVQRHTIETGELRKRNSILAERIQRLDGTTMSTAPSSTGFSAEFSDFDHLTMNSSPWDNFSLANDFSIEAEPSPDMTNVSAPKPERSAIKEDDKAATSGLLLILLLCGAWVASRGRSTSVDLLPTMPEDIRVASATVLGHIYKDAGIHIHDHYPSSFAEGARPSPMWTPGQNTMSTYEIAGSLSRNGPLDALHHRLTTPSDEQLRDQVFSLTPSQYNDLSADVNFNQRRVPPFTGRRNLGEALAAVRGASEGTAAEVYTRSLMWEKVPNEVVRDFARLVAKSSSSAHSQ